MGEGQYWPAAHGNTWRDAKTERRGRANTLIDDGQWQMGWEDQAATAEWRRRRRHRPRSRPAACCRTIPKEGGNTFHGFLRSSATRTGTRATRHRAAGVLANSADLQLQLQPRLRRRSSRKLMVLRHAQHDTRAVAEILVPGLSSTPEERATVSRRKHLGWPNFQARAGSLTQPDKAAGGGSARRLNAPAFG
jgi:hypothetical protein